MIVAKIVADSISAHTKQRITTFELDYPRFIHAELMTHRLFSRNAASSRAIPIQTMIDNIKATTAMPVYWGKNQSGMQAKQEVSELDKHSAMSIWTQARDTAIEHALSLNAIGVHKQIVNRLLEPFQTIKTLVTATSYDNWFNLRLHKDAQPEIHELAKVMYEALALSKPMELNYGEWHLPYIERELDYYSGINYFILTDGLKNDLTLEQAQKISCSCAAQVSYRKQDTSIDKAINIYDKLVNSKPVHASAFEHCATPIGYLPDEISLFPNGITHLTWNKNTPIIPCSGNFTNWIQYRQLIKGNVCTHFELEVN